LNDLREYWSVDEQGKGELVAVELNAVLDRALSYLSTGIHEAGAVITRDPLPSLLAEQYPLTLLLQNLIGNAIKYSRPGTPAQIHVSARQKKGNWEFSVRDNGMGIEAKELERIFAPFIRLHGTEYPGSGLGLAMCKRIVERYNGRIWAE